MRTTIISAMLLAMTACGTTQDDPSNSDVGVKSDDDELELYRQLVEANSSEAFANEQLAVCETSVEGFGIENDVLSEELASEEEENDTLSTELVTATVEKENAEEKFAVCEATLEVTTIENESLNSTVAGLESTNSTMLEEWTTCEDEKDEIESKNAVLQLNNEQLEDFVFECSVEKEELTATLDEQAVDLADYAVQVTELEGTVSELHDELDEMEEEGREALGKYVEASSRLSLIQENCHSVECFRTNAPQGEEASGQELIDAMVVDGNYIARIVADDDTGKAPQYVAGQAGKELWVVEEPESQVASFYVDEDNEGGWELEVGGATYVLDLKSVVDDDNVTISVNGEVVAAKKGTLAYLSNGDALQVQYVSDESAYGSFLGREAVSRAYHYTIPPNGVVQESIPGSFGFRVEVGGVTKSLPSDDPYYTRSLDDGGGAALLDLRMKLEDGNFFYSRRDVEAGSLTEWPFLTHVSAINSETGEVGITVFDYTKVGEEGSAYQTDTVDPVLDSTTLFDLLDGTPTVLVDTACGSLTRMYLTTLEGMDNTVDCTTLEQHVIGGPQVFVRKVVGAYVALATGNSESDIEQAVKLLDDYQPFAPATGATSSTSGGGGGSTTEVPEPSSVPGF